MNQEPGKANIRKILAAHTLAIYAAGNIIVLVLGVVLTVLQPNGTFGAIGTSLMATALASGVLISYQQLERHRTALDTETLDVKLNEVTEAVGVIEAQNSQILAGRVIAGAVESGLDSVITDISFEQLFSSLQAGDDVLWLATYVARVEDFIESLLSALKRDVHVYMLWIDPDCANARSRAAEANETLVYGGLVDYAQKARATRDEIINSVEAQGLQAWLAIKLYKDLPCAPMFIVLRDDRPVVGYIGFYLERPIIRTLHIRWTPGETLQNMCMYFQRKWSRSGLAVYPAPAQQTGSTDSARSSIDSGSGRGTRRTRSGSKSPDGK